MKVQLLLGILLLTAVSVFAQENVTVKGKVTDKNNESLPGVTVQCLNNMHSTAADLDGVFTLTDLPAKSDVKLRITFIGYTAVEKVINLSAGSIDTVRITLMNNDGLALSEVVVTGVNNRGSKLKTSLSVSTLRPSDYLKAAPQTTAEIFKSIPGIRSESSGGEGNTNITVRGVPLSSGGSKYLQLQEDGLPVLQFGDIAFATADIFLRADQNISRIEAVRGGSASTQATNSPAGIINFISKTGVVEGGSLSTSIGLDYRNFRTDFDYGSPLGNGVSFHVGGFYRTGDGPRTANFTANSGGQFKANLTKQFDKGYVRINFKFLDDRAAAYLPMPVQVTGTNSNPTYTSLPTFDIKKGALQTPYLLQTQGLGSNGSPYTSNVSDGMHPISKSIGAEMQFDLGDDWTLEDRGRASFNSGEFIAPFPAVVGTTSSLLGQIATATGTNLAGATVTNGITGQLAGSQAMIIHMFDANLNNFNNFVNDFKIRKKLDNINLTFGYYKSSQNIDMDWLFNSYLMTLEGKNSQPLNITTAGGASASQNGLFAYGVPLWGNLHRNYNVNYDISAPYAGLAIDITKKLNFDGSIRYDIGRVRGTYSGDAQSAFDVNHDETIGLNEKSVSSINSATAKPVNYNYEYLSYSFGLNYLMDDSKAIFARYSSGAAAQADRILFSSTVSNDGSAVGKYNRINQGELGLKYKYNKGGIFLTGFYAKTDEAGEYEVTTQKIIQNSYRAFGAEFEGVLNLTGNFDLRANATYTHARIISGALNGNKPRRQADLIYGFTPTYTIKKLSFGASVIGTTSSFTQDVNSLILPAYVYVNPFLMFHLNKNWNVSLNFNNVFNVTGFTESEEGAITENQTNVVRARSITGRTMTGTLSYSF
ncbi:TonB-dependent receptor domain-containing protein [Arcticibacter eurypsychrophilus]|uniref:TonB-dependent receptor domain-containing protein n=1 Tax=Arcticibacter eurypsychrophilus TaxID=1434752 RepID=UPI0009F38222|nr:TonB-dependent receptor [Arcticibacter eurypsychrophilus]